MEGLSWWGRGRKDADSTRAEEGSLAGGHISAPQSSCPPESTVALQTHRCLDSDFSILGVSGPTPREYTSSTSSRGQGHRAREKWSENFLTLHLELLLIPSPVFSHTSPSSA